MLVNSVAKQLFITLENASSTLCRNVKSYFLNMYVLYLYVICKMLFSETRGATTVVITVVFKQVIYCLVNTMKTSVI